MAIIIAKWLKTTEHRAERTEQYKTSSRQFRPSICLFAFVQSVSHWVWQLVELPFRWFPSTEEKWRKCRNGRANVSRKRPEGLKVKRTRCITWPMASGQVKLCGNFKENYETNTIKRKCAHRQTNPHRYTNKQINKQIMR